MTVTGLYKKTEKGKPPVFSNTLQLIKDKGIKEDIHAKGGDRQVILIDSEGYRKAEEFKSYGLCIKRFYANIVISGLKDKDINMSVKLFIGESIIQITKAKKKCFKECSLVQNNNICTLPNSTLFAKVIKGGQVALGDDVIIK